mgnify:CR=1 FL=1
MLNRWVVWLQVVNYESPDSWTPKDLLRGTCTLASKRIIPIAEHTLPRCSLVGIAVRDPPFHALIDTGALITGMTNEGEIVFASATFCLFFSSLLCLLLCVFCVVCCAEVARFLLENGLPSTHWRLLRSHASRLVSLLIKLRLADMEGVVFLDRSDKQMILLRSSGKILDLAQCGVPKEKRFTFYDQGLPTVIRTCVLTRSFVLRSAHDRYGYQAGAQRHGRRHAGQRHDLPRSDTRG